MLKNIRSLHHSYSLIAFFLSLSPLMSIVFSLSPLIPVQSKRPKALCFSSCWPLVFSFVFIYTNFPGCRWVEDFMSWTVGILAMIISPSVTQPNLPRFEPMPSNLHSEIVYISYPLRYTTLMISKFNCLA